VTCISPLLSSMEAQARAAVLQTPLLVLEPVRKFPGIVVVIRGRAFTRKEGKPYRLGRAFGDPCRYKEVYAAEQVRKSKVTEKTSL
jgi:hypothetical protein